MLDAPIAPTEAIWPMPAAAGQTVTLADAAAFLRRQFWFIAGSVASIAALAVLYLLATPAEYVGRADLLIEPGKQRALWQDSGVVDLTIDSAQVESQVEVLRSERIANDVIAKLNLINDPEFRGAGSDYQRQRAALARFESALGARRVGQSYVIEVSFRSRDSAKAALIANAITDAYLRDQQQAKRDVAQQASQWMEDEITHLGVQLNTAAAAVQEFRVSHGIAATAVNGDQPQLIDKLTELEAKAQAYRKVYEGLLERFTENQQQASYPVSNARVITSASRPLVKTYPKAGLLLLLSMLVGLVTGIAGAAARSILDGSIRGAKQVKEAAGIAILGSLPALREEPGATEARVEVIEAPLSPFADAMRNVKISAQHACRNLSGRCLGLLPLQPGDEAGTLAINLAALFEASGSQTLLVDADRRGRRLTERLAPDARIGFGEALRGGATDKLLYDRKTNAHLLPVGAAPSSVNAADFLDSAALPALLKSLKAQFATILVDLPPLRQSSDARIVAQLLDGCILVVVQGRTPLRVLEEAVDRLQADNVNLLGLVIAGASEGIPPLFNLHLDQVRGFDYAGRLRRLPQSLRERWAREGWR